MGLSLKLSPSSFQLRGFGLLPGLRLWSDVTNFADSLSGGLRGLEQYDLELPSIELKPP